MLKENTEVSKIIDISGNIYPYTFIEIREALKFLKKGEILEVLLDYEPVVKEVIPVFCKEKGYPIEIKNTKNGVFRLWIEKTD